MPDHEDAREVSQETQRLVESLGQRLAGAARQYGGSEPARRRDQIEQRSVNDEKVRDLERQIEITRAQVAEGEAELRRLEEMREFLMRDLYTPRSELQLASASMREPDQPQTRDYLAPVLAAAAEQRSASFWLWGDNARERRTALEALGVGVRRTRAPWSVIEVDFVEGGRPTSAPRAGGKLPYIIKDVWEHWTPETGPQEMRMMQFNLGEASRGPIVLVLADFPGRRRNAASFLTWMREQLTMATGMALLIVSSDRPPRDDATAGQVIECVSAGTRIGRKVAALRLERGWNRAELAVRSELDATYLAELEGGLIDDVQQLEVKRIALAMGVPTWDLDRP